MKTRFLFPRQYKIPGIILLVFGLVFFYISQHFDKEFIIWHNLRPHSLGGGDPAKDECFDNEIQLAAVLIGLVLISFSKEKIEDEQINQLRLESLQWAVYVNYAVFFVIIFTVYGLNFFAFTMYNVLTLLVFFILRFRWAIYRNSRYIKEDAI